MDNKKLSLYLSIVIFSYALTTFSSVLPEYISSNSYFYKYPQAAAQYLNNTLQNERILDYSPTYLSLNILATKAAKLHDPYIILLYTQTIIASLSCILLFLLLCTFFSPYVSVLGPVLLLTNKSFILYTLALEPEALMMFFVLGFLLNSARKKPLAPLLAGIFLGLSIATRPNFFYLSFLFPVHFFINNENKAARRKAIILFLIPLAVILSMLCIRNSRLTGEPTLFGMSPGPVIYQGNNPLSNGESCSDPTFLNAYSRLDKDRSDFQHVTYKQFARKIKGENLTAKQVNAFWIEKVKDFALDNPLYFTKLILRKAYYIFHTYRRHDLKNVFYNDHYVLKNYPSLGFAFIATLALMGMVLFLDKLTKDWLIIYSVLLLQSALMLATHVSDRQRAVIIPVIVFFAVSFISKLFFPQEHSAAALTNRSKPDLKSLVFLGAAILIIPLFLSLNHNDDIIGDELHRWHSAVQVEDRYLKAQAALESGDKGLAIKNLTELVAYSPYKGKVLMLPGLTLDRTKLYSDALKYSLSLDLNNHSYLFDLAYLYIENGKFEQAETIYLTLLRNHKSFNRQFAQSSLLEFYMARIAEKLKKKDKAIEFLQKGLKKNPGDPWVLAHLYVITDDKTYKDRLIRYFDIIDANYYISTASEEIFGTKE